MALLGEFCIAWQLCSLPLTSCTDLVIDPCRESSDCKTTLFEGMMSKQIN